MYMLLSNDFVEWFSCRKNSVFFFCLFLYLGKLDGLAVVWLFFSVQGVVI